MTAGSLSNALSLVKYGLPGTTVEFSIYTNTSQLGSGYSGRPIDRPLPVSNNPTYSQEFETFTSTQSGQINTFLQTTLSHYLGTTFSPSTAGSAAFRLGAIDYDYSAGGGNVGGFTLVDPALPTDIRFDVWFLNTGRDPAQPFSDVGGVAGDVFFVTMIHEIGHALGLAHTSDVLPGQDVDEDIQKFSVMSYNTDPNLNNPAYELQLYDVAALQFLYGANTGYNAENTTYNDFRVQYPIGGGSYDRQFALWDGGGVDTIDSSAYARSAFIDLRPGHFSSIGSSDTKVRVVDGKVEKAGKENVSIAFGTVIENAIGGSKADGIVGNSYSNSLSGGGGNDVIYGDGAIASGKLAGRGDYTQIVKGATVPVLVDRSAQQDTLDGGSGDDFLVGSEGTDTIFGGTDNDTVQGTAGGDRVDLGAGNDSMANASSGTQVWGGVGDDTMTTSDNARFMDAQAGDKVTDLAGNVLTGAIHWKGSSNAYAFSLNGQYGYGKNHEGDLVIRDFVGDYLSEDGRSEFFIAGYVGGPGAEYQSGGVFLAEGDIGFYRLIDERPSHFQNVVHAFDVAAAMLKANYGVMHWGNVDPLVLDLDGDGLDLTAISGVDLVFDIDGDGYAEPSGWVRPDDGLLALDANADGQIGSVDELFGGAGSSGFAELATHDGNADGVINAADAVFANLRVWQDLDSDRNVDAGELRTLGDVGIASISTSSTAASSSIATNRIAANGSFTKTGGGTSVISDVGLVTNNQNTQFLGDRSISSAAEALPELKGYGTLTDLRVAMTLDPTLQGVVSTNLPNLASLDLATLRAAAMPILTAWAEASPITGRPPLLPHGDIPVLIQIVNNEETVADFAYRPTGATYWRLASGTAVKDSGGNVIAEPTLQQILADTHLQGAWSSFSGSAIAFFERYSGELLPLDTAPTNPGQVLPQMTELIDGFWTLQNSMAVRLAMQGPLASFFPGLRYDAETDGFYATTSRQLIPSFEAIFNEAKALSSGQIGRLEAWERVLNIVIADYHQQPDELLNTHGFLFSNIVAAYESTGLSLGIVAVADALGIPADLVRTGTGALTGGNDADLFYLSAGNQTASGGLGPDTYVVGGGFGQDVINDLEGASSPASEDVVRFADIDSTEVTARREGIDLIISVNGTTDELRIKDHFDGRSPGVGGGGDFSDSTGVDFIVFADGANWTPLDVARAVARPEAGAQTIAGTETVDWLDGAAGDDSLTGGDDADVYVYGRGYGDDVVRDDTNNLYLQGPDTVVFKTDVSISDVHFSRQGNSEDLIVQIDGESGSLTVKEQFDKSYTGVFGGFMRNQVESFRAADGAFSAEEVMQLLIDQGQTAGDDTIYGFSREDDISGGEGNDYLSGGNENDIYRYDLGDGNDVVHDAATNLISGMTDEVVFGLDVDPLTVIITRVPDTYDAKFTFADGGSLIVEDQFKPTATGPFGLIWFDRIETFRFEGAPGTTWTADYVMSQALANAKTAGNDLVEGYWRQDTLDGGAGDDRLQGAEESDTYVFGRGYGHDTIFDNANGLQTTDVDVVRMNADVAPGDIVFERTGLSTDFTLRISGTEDRLTIEEQNSGFDWWRISEVRFTDGTVWSQAFLREEYLLRSSTTGADVINGFETADNIGGVAGNDTLDGAGGADTLAGGADNDRVDGGAGNDRLIFNAGDGADSIYEDYRITETDRLVLGTGLTSAAMTITRSATDLDDVTLGFGANGSIFIDEQFSSNSTGYGVEEIQFGDGTVWTKAQLLNAALSGATPGNDALTGGAGADALSGFEGDDTLSGLAGTDTLTGGLGNDRILPGGGGDTISFDSGDGTDTLIEDYVVGETDRLVLGAGLTAASMTITRSTSDLDDITLNFGANGSIVIDEQFYVNSPGNGVEQIQFGDGTTWSKADLVNAYVTQSQTSGNDTINGGEGAETIVGGAGNDRVDGRQGGDRFVFNSGDGADTIIEDHLIFDTDRLILGAGLTSASMTITRSTSDLDDITLNFGANGSIFIDEQFYTNSAGRGVEQITFGDGAVWTKADLVSAYITQTQTSGNDTINGGEGVDTITGGAGNDRLDGRQGGDRFVFNSGDGADTIVESHRIGETDQLVLGTGLTAASMTITRSTSDLDDVTLSFGASGSLFIDEQFYLNNQSYGVEQITFGDGTVWTKLDLLNAYISRSQTSGDDTVYGSDGADTLQGGAGNDRLDGLGGNDRFVFNSGDGVDSIFEDNRIGQTDRLVLGSGLTVAAMTVTRSTSDLDDVTLSFGASGSVFIDEQFYVSSASEGIEQIQFGDGTLWSKTDLQNAYLATKLTASNDSVVGFSDNDVLASGAGDDTVSSITGNDTITGGGGADRLSGGSGTDRFVYTALADAPTAGGLEIITDFSQGSDKIDLTALDANSGVGGDQAFAFIGTAAFSNVAGQLRYATTPSGSRTVYGDVNGDGVADFQIQLTGSLTLAASDFLL